MPPSVLLPPQNVFQPGGPQAGHVLELGGLVVAVCGVVFAAVLVALLWSQARDIAAYLYHQ